ncbi:MgtC/SapB family protein [Nitrospina gracilis]|uniref:MgtC/SapB family protein n=1 Tax=Nitrospina gracilis TaxID=35801 RepID=UPI001F159CB2|nr:MgtC/SapB family protein [Nitrospina gracilis]MCF8721141.1 putative Mg2+ transporter-C (MgtC) family protein [Nitrospina gracilis Nb-211]
MDIEWWIDGEVLLRLLLAIVLGGVVGLEREIHGRPAGFRTHIVVCLGATVMILGTEYYSQSMESGTILDVNRMSAGIITGIGFLGGGAILRESDMVRGLTTAGCVWFVAGLGIVIGKGIYPLALWATLFVFIMLFFFRFVGDWIPIDQYKAVVVQTSLTQYENVRRKCAEVFLHHGFSVEDIHFKLNKSRNEAEIDYRLSFKKGTDREAALIGISQIEGVLEVRG